MWVCDLCSVLAEFVKIMFGQMSKPNSKVCTLVICQTFVTPVIQMRLVTVMHMHL